MLFMFNPILILAAVLPALYLLRYVYQKDRLEPESPGLLRRLVFLGLLATILAGVAESVGGGILGLFFPENTVLYDFFMYFAVVGFAEEGFKYLLMKRATWNNEEFNCMFDGVVYAVTVSLGFALWENIAYVAQYGFVTALVRAVTAIPGHASFGVFMGALYGISKSLDAYGHKQKSVLYRRLCVIVPALLHGFYDFIATGESGFYTIVFFAFIALLFAAAKRAVDNLSKQDHYI